MAAKKKEEPAKQEVGTVIETTEEVAALTAEPKKHKKPTVAINRDKGVYNPAERTITIGKGENAEVIKVRKPTVKEAAVLRGKKDGTWNPTCVLEIPSLGDVDEETQQLIEDYNAKYGLTDLSRLWEMHGYDMKGGLLFVATFARTVDQSIKSLENSSQFRQKMLDKAYVSETSGGESDTRQKPESVPEDDL